MMQILITVIETEDDLEIALQKGFTKNVTDKESMVCEAVSESLDGAFNDLKLEQKGDGGDK